MHLSPACHGTVIEATKSDLDIAKQTPDPELSQSTYACVARQMNATHGIDLDISSARNSRNKDPVGFNSQSRFRRFDVWAACAIEARCDSLTALLIDGLSFLNITR